MSTLQAPQRPVFNSLEPGLDSDLTPPISFLAIVAMLLGIFSLLTAISINVLPFAIVVAILCAVLIWKLSRDTTVGGLRLAQIGLCCAIVGGTWGLTANRLTAAYMYSQAGEHAKLFLQTLSSGKQFEAFELTQPESERLVTGTDIEAHYSALLASAQPMRTEMSMPEDMPSGETMKNSRSKEDLEAFLSNNGTKEILAHGANAKWEFVRGAGVARMSDTENRITVVMVDTANPTKKFQVELNRGVGQFVAVPGKLEVAVWDVDKTKVVKE